MAVPSNYRIDHRVSCKLPSSSVSAGGAGRPMPYRMRSLWVLLMAGAVTLGSAGTRAPLEDQKINFLITSIETLGDATFVRNGTAYDAKTAADHLRLKLRHAGTRVRTADDFIRYCASVSSLTGTPYQIHFADGHVETSEFFLRQKLSQFPTQ
jgi:hypothetical protein